MYQSLFTNAMVSIVLGVLLPILYFVANHFIKEKKFLTVADCKIKLNNFI